MLGNVIQGAAATAAAAAVVVVLVGPMFACGVERLEMQSPSLPGDNGATGRSNVLHTWSLSLQKTPADGWLYSIVHDWRGRGPSASRARQEACGPLQGMPGVVVPAR